MASSKACTCIFYRFVIFGARLPGAVLPYSKLDEGIEGIIC